MLRTSWRTTEAHPSMTPKPMAAMNVKERLREEAKLFIQPSGSHQVAPKLIFDQHNIPGLVQQQTATTLKQKKMVQQVLAARSGQPMPSPVKRSLRERYEAANSRKQRFWDNQQTGHSVRNNPQLRRTREQYELQNRDRQNCALARRKSHEGQGIQFNDDSGDGDVNLANEQPRPPPGDSLVVSVSKAKSSSSQSSQPSSSNKNSHLDREKKRRKERESRKRREGDSEKENPGPSKESDSEGYYKRKYEELLRRQKKEKRKEDSPARKKAKRDKKAEKEEKRQRKAEERQRKEEGHSSRSDVKERLRPGTSASPEKIKRQEQLQQLQQARVQSQERRNSVAKKEEEAKARAAEEAKEQAAKEAKARAAEEAKARAAEEAKAKDKKARVEAVHEQLFGPESDSDSESDESDEPDESDEVEEVPVEVETVAPPDIVFEPEEMGEASQKEIKFVPVANLPIARSRVPIILEDTQYNQLEELCGAIHDGREPAPKPMAAPPRPMSPPVVTLDDDSDDEDYFESSLNKQEEAAEKVITVFREDVFMVDAALPSGGDFRNCRRERLHVYIKTCAKYIEMNEIARQESLKEK